MSSFDSTHIELCMQAGCGTYIQGTNVLSRTGELLRQRGLSRPMVVTGKTAYEKAGKIVCQALKQCGYDIEVVIYTAPCVIEDAQALCQKALMEKRDCVIGIGGGKVLDMSKAIAGFAALPVFCVPTIAATCAATTALSAMYGCDGKYVKNLYHSASVAGVVTELNVLIAAPTRYLASGIADSFAKACEYSAFQKRMKYETSDFGRFMGYNLALHSDELLLQIGRAAFDANAAGQVNQAFCDAVSCVIPIIGVISGIGAYAVAGGARFAVAHAFNELIRGRYVTDVNRWLHGELVGVGVLCQMVLNGLPEEEILTRRSLMRSMGLPTCLNDLGIDTSPQGVRRFTDDLIAMKQFDTSRPEIVLKAIQAIAR